MTGALPTVYAESDRFVVQYEKDIMAEVVRHKATGELVLVLMGNYPSFEAVLGTVERAYQMGLEHAEVEAEKADERAIKTIAQAVRRCESNDLRAAALGALKKLEGLR